MRLFCAATVGILVAVVVPDPAAAAARKLSVSRTTGLSRAGELVTVTGRGYDTSKGIYVAFCVDNGAGALPTPCGGGADMSGSSGASAWISSNPPAYGEGLAIPYRSGGGFQVSIAVSRMIGDVDCVVRACAIVTRADHTRTSDRSQDVRIPIRFAAEANAAPPATQGARNPAPAATGTVPKGQKSPVGPPTGRLATAAPPSASAAPAALALDVPRASLARTTAATPLGHWWAVLGAFAAGLALATLAGRIRRHRASRKAAS